MCSFCGTVSPRDVTTLTRGKEEAMTAEIPSELEDIYIRASERRYPYVDRMARIAIRWLYGQSDPQQSLDGQGFNRRDYTSDFVQSLRTQERAYTHRQLTEAYRMLMRYTKQFEAHNIPLPTRDAFQNLIATLQEEAAQPKNLAATTKRTKPFLDKRGESFWLSFNYTIDHVNHIKDYKAEQYNKRTGIRVDYRGETKEWEIRPASEAALIALTDNKYFPLSNLELSPTAQEIQAAIENRNAEAVERTNAIEQAAQDKYFALLETLGGLKGSFGKYTPFKHQKDCVKLGLYKSRLIIGDETGVGKSLEAALIALAYFRLYGYRVYVVTTVSSMADWRKLAEELGLPVEIMSWGEVNIRDLSNDMYPFPYIAIVDEAQNMCNLTSARTQRMIEWLENSNCKGCYLLSGTWMPNGRPINLYPLLLATHHPLVWSDSPSTVREKKSYYTKTFCGAKAKRVSGGRTITDVTGATNLFLLSRHIMYIVGDKDNGKYANLISRMKIECRDIPPKVRVMQPVTLSIAALNIFTQAVERMFADFERNVQKKLETFIENWRAAHGDNTPIPDGKLEEEEMKVRSATAIVSYGIFRHAGAIAKTETTIDMAKKVLFENEKLVIFTTFLDVAQIVGQTIERETGKKVAYIAGEVKAEERERINDDFQNPNGTIQVVISTAAGGEAITLNAAKYMLVIDRPWTPGRVKQWEDRIHRINNIREAIIYWLQLPEHITKVDIKVDALIQEKQKNIDMVATGRASAGMQFADTDSLEGHSLEVLMAAKKDLQKVA